MNFNKRVNGSWVDAPHYIHKTDTDTITTLPADLYADGNSATVGLVGNMQQSGTPYPTTPIQPSECGDMSSNLVNISDFTATTDPTQQDKVLWSGTLPVGTYTFSIRQNNAFTSSTRNTIHVKIGSTNYYESTTTNYHNDSGKHSYTFTISDSTVTVTIYYWTNAISNDCLFSQAMLNVGDEALPYDKYGQYKIPISSGGKNLFDKDNFTFGTDTTIVYVPLYVGDGFFTLSTNFPYNATKDVFLLTGNVTTGASSQYNGVCDGAPMSRESTDGYLTIATRYNSVRSNPADYNYMLNEGSTALPYKPYNRTTTNVYLGEVQSIRRIKQLVFDGTEDWKYNGTNFYLNISSMSEPVVSNSPLICSHFVNSSQGMKNGTNWAFVTLYQSATSANAWKAYLQQQYSNDTPVTVWYVLATETTGIVNEPIRKIGDYADTVSGITIPTIAGTNTISIGTTLQPSEVTVNYKGWHPVADVHVYPDSSWMPTSWEEFRKAVRSGKAQSLYPVGTKLYENWGDTTSDAWIVVDYPTGEDYLDSDLAQQGYTNRVMLMEEKLNYLRQFDAIEAWLYVETAIPAGTYRFTIPNYDAIYGGNKTYIFTSTANVPVGGQLTLTWAYQQNPSAVQAYSSATSTSALFNVSITEWDGTTACTDLGTIKLAQNDADSTYGKLNHIHRARYGSNNYYQSGYRQWLNTNASANWWTPTNVFDRPYGNRTNAGRLNVMNSNMKSVLATPTVNCITNNLFEYPSLDGTTFSLQTAYTVKDKLFPVTHSEINLSSSPNVNSVLDYYVGKGNADRIKYRKDNGNAYYWWLRTPYPTNAGYVRFVGTSGALNGSYASNALGSAAACIIQ